LEQWSNLPHTLAPVRMNKEKRRKNETSTYIPFLGCSPFTCLQLSLAESRLYACDASLEITKSMIIGDFK
jgi:hypothetical protein